ncbi:Myosin-14 [Chionoecetes opilio]|uniref:Myosin-14 n=1 Tax=Chionoecetes opilio TaxID=41210 RepID=A0A8J5CQK9_CHIOP|nr:Myosin-14 [Chionoecetes opilio]
MFILSRRSNQREGIEWKFMILDSTSANIDLIEKLRCVGMAQQAIVTATLGTHQEGMSNCESALQGATHKAHEAMVYGRHPDRRQGFPNRITFQEFRHFMNTDTQCDPQRLMDGKKALRDDDPGDAGAEPNLYRIGAKSKIFLS